jgi:hypothetical protein
MNRHDFIAPAIALGAVLLHFSEQRSRQDEVDRLMADLTTLSRRVRDLASDVAAQDRAWAAPLKTSKAAPAPAKAADSGAPSPAPNAANAASPRNAAPSTPPADAPAPTETPMPSPATMAKIASVRDKFQGQFDAERSDPRWAAEAESTLKEKLGGMLPDSSKIQSIDCRATMCRIETVHENMDRFRQFMGGAFMDPNTKVWNGGFFSSPVGEVSDGGKLDVVTYVAREGQELPRLDQQGPQGP